MDDKEMLVLVEQFQQLLIDHATGGAADEEEYTDIRERLVTDSSIKPFLPRFVTTCRNPNQFWSHIKFKYGTYAERRAYIWEAFQPLVDRLEGLSTGPIDQPVAAVLSSLDIEHVQEIWVRALARRAEEPDAAITAARTLLESTCKVILDELGESYTDKDTLPKLYARVSKELNLAPSQHTEQIFKQILGGCQAVVEGLGAVRNKLSDAHGKGKKPVRPDHRHAELAINLAGAMSIFLIQTMEKHQEETAS